MYRFVDSSGFGFGHCVNFSWTFWLTAYLAEPEFYPDDFFKQIHFRVDESFYKRANVDVVEEKGKPVSGVMGIGYVGNTSFVMDTEITLNQDAKPTFKISRVCVAVGPDGKATKVDPIWKSKRLQEAKRRGLDNKRPEVLAFPNVSVIYSTAAPIHDQDLDINGHAHFKLYLMRAFAAMISAFERRLFTPEHCVDFHWARVASVCCVFENGAILGDNVECNILRPGDGDDYSLYAVLKTHSGTRLAYLRVTFYDKLGFPHLLTPKL